MEKTKKAYCVAVASGHSETHFLACKRSKNPSNLNDLEFVRHHKGLSLNLHWVSEQERKKRFKDGLLEVIPEANLDDCYVCLSMPGISTETHLEDALTLLTQFPQFENINGKEINSSNKISIVDDTVSGLIAGIGSLKGVCAFSGMGSSVFNGLTLSSLPSVAARPHKIDGYGPLLGDRGSGFKISVELLSKSLIVFEKENAENLLGIKPKHRDRTQNTKNAHKTKQHQPPNKDVKDVLDLLSIVDPKLDYNNCQKWFDQLIEDSARSQTKSILKWLHDKHPKIEEEMRCNPEIKKTLDQVNIDSEPMPWYVRIANLNKEVCKVIDEKLKKEEINSKNFGEPGSWTDLACTALSRGAIEMANSTRIAILSSNDHEKTPIVCQGGMMTRSEFYFQEFKRVLSGFRREIIRSPFPPVIGALAIAIKQNNSPPDYKKEYEAIQKLDQLKQFKKEHPENKAHYCIGPTD
jgi:N-acetylglucosamine kinase-like BadF-type ATPase